MRLRLLIRGTTTSLPRGPEAAFTRFLRGTICLRWQRRRAARWALYVSGWILLRQHAHAAVVSFLNPHGPIAAAQTRHFTNVNLLMLIAVLPVLIGAPLIAWHFRHGNTKARYRPKWSHSWPLEGLIWGGPVAIVLVLSLWLGHDTTKLDPYTPSS